MIDLTFRSFTRDRWLQFAVNQGIYEGLDAQGNPIAKPGVDVDEIGNYVITPAVLNPDGTVQTPAVLDTWWMTNVRLTGRPADDDVDDLYPGDTDDGFKFRRSKIARAIRNNATLVTVGGYRAFQIGNGVNRVQIFDPRDISEAPQRVWFGGMNY